MHHDNRIQTVLFNYRYFLQATVRSLDTVLTGESLSKSKLVDEKALKGALKQE